MSKDYLFTWKVDKWPYDKLKTLVENFNAGSTVTEPWRCAAHRQIAKGDTAYFFKQGGQPRGIFAVGTISGLAIENKSASDGESKWQVPITFDALVDPISTLLVPEARLLEMPAPPHRWRTQSSGVHLEAAVARAIDRHIEAARLRSPLPPQAADDAFDVHNLKDARERINRAIVTRRGQRAFRSKLLIAYDGRCAITGCDVKDLLEAAHIVPYRGVDTNHPQNGILLRSDIHTLFDCGLITIDPHKMTIVMAPRLKQSSYKRLENRPIRCPKDHAMWPSAAALAEHRKAAGL